MAAALERRRRALAPEQEAASSPQEWRRWFWRRRRGSDRRRGRRLGRRSDGRRRRFRRWSGDNGSRCWFRRRWRCDHRSRSRWFWRRRCDDRSRCRFRRRGGDDRRWSRRGRRSRHHGRGNRCLRCRRFGLRWRSQRDLRGRRPRSAAASQCNGRAPSGRRRGRPAAVPTGLWRGCASSFRSSDSAFACQVKCSRWFRCGGSVPIRADHENSNIRQGLLWLTNPLQGCAVSAMLAFVRGC